MNRKRNINGSFSSSSAFIIILILIVVSVAAIIVGGGDGFARKYAGVTFKDIATQSVLAQTGVVGKNLRFTSSDGSNYTLEVSPIELDGEVLGVNEKYAAAVVPPLEGDSPFWYRTSVKSNRNNLGYPLRKEFVEDYGDDLNGDNGNDSNPDAGGLSPLAVNTVPGFVDCSASSGGFIVFFEDLAYETGVGFDDATFGESRRDAVCEVMQEFETTLNLDESGLKPGIVVQASEGKTPIYSLSVVAPQYVGGSGFVSTLLADYLRTGVSFASSNDESVLDINSGFIRYNFDDVQWALNDDELTANPEMYDLRTVTRQNMLRLLGFGSFIGHEQENILSSSWKRWTEWDRLLKFENDPLVDPAGLAFESDENITSENASSDNYDPKLTTEGVYLSGAGAVPDFVSLLPWAVSQKPVITFNDKFQKGQSVSGLADPDGASYPIIDAGTRKPVTQAEKEVLCMLGLSIDGITGCSNPRSVIHDQYIERENNKTVCVNLFDTTYNADTDQFQISGTINRPSYLLEPEYADHFTLYDVECPSPDFDTPAEKDAFDANHALGNNEVAQAKSFAWKPRNITDGVWSEYVRFRYQVKDIESGRTSDTGEVAIHKCVVTDQSNQLCNGGFEYSGSRSPIDFQLSSLEDTKTTLDTDVIGCLSTTTPGWCGQGTPDVFSSEYGYTWHPYFITDTPDGEVDDTETGVNDDGTRKYAGGVAGEILVQRLRVPLQSGRSYLLTGKVYTLASGQRPKVWYVEGEDGSCDQGSCTNIPKQNDGTYHINYPFNELDGVHELDLSYFDQEYYDENDGAIRYIPQPLTAGQWVEFGVVISGENVTHIALGGVDNSERIFFDDLSLKYNTGCGSCVGDINGDCTVNSGDLGALLGSYDLDCAADTVGCLTDINYDGTTNSGDLGGLLSMFGQSCSQVSVPTIVENTGDNLEEGTLGSLAPEGLEGDPAQNILRASESDDSVSNSDVAIGIEFVGSEQVIPNSQGFRSNFKMQVRNVKGGDIEDLNLIGVIPAQLEYANHVSTKENIAYSKSSNTIIIPELEDDETLEIYYSVKLNGSVCEDIRRDYLSKYGSLVDAGLCDSEEVVNQKKLELQYGLRLKDEDLRGLSEKEIQQRQLESKYGIIRDSSGGVQSTSGGGDYGECTDKIDNDGDGLIDRKDPDCAEKTSVSEGSSSSTPECNDGIDNDGDKAIDLADPDCTDKNDTSESGGVTQCNDGIDNDGDGKTDYPADRQCTSAADNNESK